MALGLYRWEDVRMAMEDVLTRSSVLDKERVRKNLERVLKGERQYVAIRDMLNPEVSEKEKLMEIRYLKNANYHPGIPVYLSLVKDVIHLLLYVKLCLNLWLGLPCLIKKQILSKPVKRFCREPIKIQIYIRRQREHITD